MGILRRFLFHDIGLKLFSLVMATCLWAVVMSQENIAQTEWKASLDLHNVPANLVISSPSLPVVQLRLSGPSRILDHISGNVHVSIDLANAQPGERTFGLSSRDVHLPRGVEVQQIKPAQVTILLDVRETRTVDVHPRVVGRLASGFAISKVVAEPARITIVGPRSHVKMADAITGPVDATGLLTQHTFSAEAYVSDPLVQVVNPEPVRVTVFVAKSSRRGD